MKWTNDEINTLLSLFKDKLSYEQISIKLNRTHSSVRLKLQKLGYKSSDEQKITKKCLFCDNLIETTLSSEKKFCNNSCSASYNNKLRKKVNYCSNCNIEIASWRIFCSNKCQGQHERSVIFEKIENGDTSFHHDTMKKFMIYKYGEKCMECGWCSVHPTTGKVPIQLEHIDGDSTNNSLNNFPYKSPFL